MLQNKTDLRDTSFHFDTFAVDFNEELTAISSEYMVMQSKYLSSAIEYVWSLYLKKPPGIVLVGHSMGGIVIQHSILLHRKNKKNKISMVLSLATPYNEPPYFFDKSILQLWLTLNMKSEQYVRSEDLRIPFVSISGGIKDEFIEEDWTTSKYYLHASTTSIDRVNVEMDHKCIIWCNQLVRQISRVLFDYAESPSTFLENPVKHLRLHYKGPGSRLKSIDAYNTQVFGREDCIPQCSSIGILSFTTSYETTGQQFLLVLSNNTKTQLVDLVCPHSMLPCPNVGLTRFLSSSVLYSFLELGNCPDGSVVKVKLEGTKTWLLSKPNVMMTNKSLSFMEIALDFIFGSPMPLRISIENGLKILPIKFVRAGEPSPIVYKVTFQSNECKAEGIRRFAFFQNNALLRMSEVDGAGNPTSMAIYELKEGGKEAMLVFISELECNYHANFHIDLFHTAIKAIRRCRHVLPFSVIIAILTLHVGNQMSFSYIYYVLLLATISFCMRNFDEIVYVILLVDTVFIFAFYLLFRLFLLPGLSFLNSVKWLTLGVVWKLVMLTTIIATSLFTHSLFIAITCSFFNLLSMIAARISNFKTLFVIITLQLLAMLLQIPSFIAYFWNLKAYGRIYAHSDPFFEANVLILLFSISETGLYTLKKPSPSKYCHLLKAFRYIFTGILQLSCFICIFLVIYRSGIYSYQVLDDLCIVCSAILGIVWSPGDLIDINKG